MFHAEQEIFKTHFPDVPQGTVEKLEQYAALLTEWNEKFNLVAPSTVPHIWMRHFLDSAQLMKFIPENTQSLADMGSGAGFPGLVLSLMGVSGIYVIESIRKKADFLAHVIEQLGLPATLIHGRVEDIKDKKFDLVTARAVTNLNDLLGLAHRLMHKNSTALFLKGQNAASELTDAQKYWMFSFHKAPSISDDSGVVLTIRDLKNHGSRNIRRKNP